MRSLYERAGAIAYRGCSGASLERLLATWPEASLRSPLERVLFRPVFSHWIRTVYLAEGDADRREALKDLCMAGASGVAYAEEYERQGIDRGARYHDVGFDEANPQYPAMDSLLPGLPADALIVQVGCSSGKEMAYFAERFPKLTFVGTDIDESITRRAQRVHPLPNLIFEVGRAHELPSRLPPFRPLVLYANGSLQYVQPEHLAAMFEALAARGRVTLVLCEPWRRSGAVIASNLRSRWRDNFSFSHDYRDYADAAGFVTAAQRVIQTAHDPASPHYETRHYFYMGTHD